MEKVKHAMGITDSPGMSNITTDQSALNEPGSEFNRKVEESDAAYDQADYNPRQINNFGGPSFGRDGNIEPHSSGVLNKLDPRVGYTKKDQEDSFSDYEKKYGKPDPEAEKGAKEPLKMRGIGTDQSALEQGEKDPTQL